MKDRADPAVERLDRGERVHLLLIAVAQVENLVHIRTAVDRRAAHQHEQLADARFEQLLVVAGDVIDMGEQLVEQLLRGFLVA